MRKRRLNIVGCKIFKNNNKWFKWTMTWIVLIFWMKNLTQWLNWKNKKFNNYEGTNQTQRWRSQFNGLQLSLPALGVYLGLNGTDRLKLYSYILLIDTDVKWMSKFNTKFVLYKYGYKMDMK
jgi:hypothetical protein